MLRALALALPLGALLSLRAERDRHPADSNARWYAGYAWCRRLDLPGAPVAAFWAANELRLNLLRTGDWRLRVVLPACAPGCTCPRARARRSARAARRAAA